MRKVLSLRSSAALAFVLATPALAWAAPKPPKVYGPSTTPPAPVALGKIVKLEEVTHGATEPVRVVAALDEAAGRLFVIEKAGLVRILRGHTFDPKPFLDMRQRVGLDKRENGERGLLGLAFHPKYSKNGRFFINYTDEAGDTRVMERRVNPKDLNSADPSYERPLLFVKQPYANHNGGDLEFGRDGKLYVGLGDGGSGGDPHKNGQNPQVMLGKMLRIDVEAATPVVETIDKGLRNPWRYSFDAKTGDLYIADVGQNTWESIQVLPAQSLTGHNLGWNVTEGQHCFENKPCDRQGMTVPIAEYAHTEGCSISGGAVYRGKALPELDGLYFYADFCTGFVRSLRYQAGKAADLWEWKPALDPESKLARLTSIDHDQNGELYLTSHDGVIYKLVRR